LIDKLGGAERIGKLTEELLDHLHHGVGILLHLVHASALLQQSP
jgi:hypothetical protein